MSDKILEINNLWVRYETEDATVRALNGINLSLIKGQTLGLVGETGAGKTTTALSILRILPPKLGFIDNGEIFFKGRNVCDLSEKEIRKIRGKEISMIFQDPMTSLNPVIPVGKQIEEVILLHSKLRKQALKERAEEMLELVGIPRSRSIEYPHQFSGGMKQRVIIAMALACNPDLIIADEPTSALDVTIQAQVLDMMNNLKKNHHTSMIMITHDLGIVAQMCDVVAIIYAGEIVEYGAVEDIFESKFHHPYTLGLFDSVPDIDSVTERLKPIKGVISDPTNLPKGCKFQDRCDFKKDICQTTLPDAIEHDGHHIKCHFAFGGK